MAEPSQGRYGAGSLVVILGGVVRSGFGIGALPDVPPVDVAATSGESQDRTTSCSSGIGGAVRASSVDTDRLCLFPLSGVGWELFRGFSGIFGGNGEFRLWWRDFVLGDVVQVGGVVHLVTSAGAVAGDVFAAAAAAAAHVFVAAGRGVHGGGARLHGPVGEVQGTGAADLHPEASVQGGDFGGDGGNVWVAAAEVVVGRVQDVAIFRVLDVLLDEDQIGVEAVDVATLVGVLR